MALGPQIVAVDAGEQDQGRGGDYIEKNDDSYQIAQAGSNGPRNRQWRRPTPGNGSGSTDGCGGDHNRNNDDSNQTLPSVPGLILAWHLQ
eukprot:scaffold126090_cov46-Cyclotella_meneghiniana.AAC.3